MDNTKYWIVIGDDSDPHHDEIEKKLFATEDEAREYAQDRVEDQPGSTYRVFEIVAEMKAHVTVCTTNLFHAATRHDLSDGCV